MKWITRGAAAVAASLTTVSMLAAPATADHTDATQFPALSGSDCQEHGGTFTWERDPDVRTCVVVSQGSGLQTLPIGKSHKTFTSTLTWEATTTYVQYGNLGDGPGGDGFNRDTTTEFELLSCSAPGGGDGVWLPGKNTCPSSIF